MLKCKHRFPQWTVGESTTSKFMEATVHRIINVLFTMMIKLFNFFGAQVSINYKLLKLNTTMLKTAKTGELK